MALDVDELSRTATLSVELQGHRTKLAAAVVQPTPAPLFIRNADGSVNTRAGVQVRGPIAPPPAKVK
jgi:hypothetical protein